MYLFAGFLKNPCEISVSWKIANVCLSLNHMIWFTGELLELSVGGNAISAPASANDWRASMRVVKMIRSSFGTKNGKFAQKFSTKLHQREKFQPTRREPIARHAFCLLSSATTTKTCNDITKTLGCLIWNRLILKTLKLHLRCCSNNPGNQSSKGETMEAIGQQSFCLQDVIRGKQLRRSTLYPKSQRDQQTRNGKK